MLTNLSIELESWKTQKKIQFHIIVMETKAQNNQHFRAMNLFLVNIGTPGKPTDTYWHFYRKVTSFEQKGYTF